MSHGMRYSIRFKDCNWSTIMSQSCSRCWWCNLLEIISLNIILTMSLFTHEFIICYHYPVEPPGMLICCLWNAPKWLLQYVKCNHIWCANATQNAILLITMFQCTVQIIKMSIESLIEPPLQLLEDLDGLCHSEVCKWVTYNWFIILTVVCCLVKWSTHHSIFLASHSQFQKH